MSRLRGEVPRAYTAGYSLHLIVYSGDPEGSVATPYGQACRRAYSLSERFPDDMGQLTRIFAGPAGGPRLYVSLFTGHARPLQARQRLGGVFAADLRVILTDRYLAELTRHGLFVMSFMDDKNLDASGKLHGFVRRAVRRYART